MKNRGNVSNNRNKGFSLIEVLVAMVILAIMTLPVLQTFASSALINGKARQQEEANAIGQKIIERFKSLTLDEMLSNSAGASYGDVLRTTADTAPGAYTGAAELKNNLTGVYDVAANKVGYYKVVNGVVSADTAYQYAYKFNMASFTGTVEDKDQEGNICYKGSNNTNYYVETIISPSKDDLTGLGGGQGYEINEFSQPAFADINSSNNYVFIDEVYKYDTSIKTMFPSRSWVVNNATTDTNGFVVVPEVTSTEKNIIKMDAQLSDKTGIKKVVVLNVKLENEGSGSSPKYTETPTLYVKYYREKDQNGNVQYTVDSKGDIKDDSGTVITSSNPNKEIFIYEKTLPQLTDINFADVDLKDIYLFYSSYDRNYGNTGMTSTDEVYINVDGTLPSGRTVNVFLCEQYISSNGSDLADREAFKDDVKIKLDPGNIYINGLSKATGNKLNQGNVSVYSQIDGWDLGEDNNITQNYNETPDRYLYTITVKIWVAKRGEGKPNTVTTQPLLTLTSTKEN